MVVNVVDTTAPAITLLGNDPETVEYGTPYTDAGATALDGYDGDVTGSISTAGSVDINTIGQYTITYDVTDRSGNVATTVSRVVNVVDTAAPAVTLLGSSPLAFEYGTPYTDAGATASDGYDGDITGSISTAGSVDINTIGQYTITYDVTDSSGNIAAKVSGGVKGMATTAPALTQLGSSPVT